MKLGQVVDANLEYDLPVIIHFISSFCSKCLYNRRVLQEYINEDDLVEVNIASTSELLDEVKPSTVPTVMVIGPDHEIVAYHEGNISKHRAQMIAALLDDQ